MNQTWFKVVRLTDLIAKNGKVLRIEIEAPKAYGAYVPYNYGKRSDMLGKR